MMLQSYYADMHIHIGRTISGRAVKITGARSLVFSNIIEHARDSKGLDMIGIIDCHSPEVIDEMEELMASGALVQSPEGGLLYGGLAIIPGSELEIYDESCKGPIHVLCYFPSLDVMKEFSSWLKGRLKNIHLSSQRIYASGKELQSQVKALGGLFIPAHVFTPFKSMYGKGVDRTLEEVFDKDLIDGIELGLSSDTEMADMIQELHQYPFLTNSDAHSLGKIAREYQQIEMAGPSFNEFHLALKREGGRRISANYGLDPQLGKYHQTVCMDCHSPLASGHNGCRECGSRKQVKGVADRIMELKTAVHPPADRPPYVHQVPLEFIPGLGPKILGRLLDHFGTEMDILHRVPKEALEEVIPDKLAVLIVKARSGQLSLKAGGGGKYGKVEQE